MGLTGGTGGLILKAKVKGRSDKMGKETKNQVELDLAQQMQQEVLKGLEKKEPLEKLFLNTVRFLALRDGDLVSYDTIYENIKTIYGLTGLKQKVPMEIELEEFQERLQRLEASLQAYQNPEDQEIHDRLCSVIEEHKQRIQRLQAELKKIEAQDGDMAG